MDSNNTPITGTGGPDDHIAPTSTPRSTDYRHARIPELRTTNSELRVPTHQRGSTRNSESVVRNYEDPRQIVVGGVC